eukprot:g6505.t1
MPALRDLIHSHKAREDVEITLFSIGVLVFLWGFAHSAGFLFKHVMKTPPLLGYLLAGICFRNIGGAVLLFAQAKTGIRLDAGTLDVAAPTGRGGAATASAAPPLTATPPQAAPHAAEPPSLVLIPADISSLVRTFGLATILMIAGGEIDFDRIRKMGGVCARLTVLPGVSEAFAVAFLSRYLFGFDWPWGLVLGFILGAVSPAVVCGGMFALQKRGFGVAKGIPSLVVCAASLDDVVAISGFTTSLGLAIAGLVEDRLLRLLSSVEDESEEVDDLFRASRSWNRVDADAGAAEELQGQRFATHYTEANYVENAGVLPSLAPRGISRFLFGKPHVPAHPSSHWRGLLHGPTNLLLGAALGICLGYVYAKLSRIVLQCTLFMPAQQQERRRRPRPKKPTVPAPETLDCGIGRGGGRRSLRESVRSTKMKAMARLPRGLQVETGSPQELGLGSGDDGGGTTTAQPRIIATRAEAAIAGLVFCTGCGVAMAAVHLQYSGAGFLACLFFTCAFSQFSRAGETDGTSRAVFSSVSSSAVGETTLSGDYDVEKMNNPSSRARLHDGEEDRRTVLGAPSELLVGVKDQYARGPRGAAALEEDDVTIAVPSQSPLGESSGVRRMMTFEMEDITARAAEAGSAGREKKDSSSPPPKTSSKKSQVGGIGLFSSSASSDDEQAASYRAQIDQDSPDLDGDFDVDEAIQAARELASGRSPAAESRDARTRESQLSESDFSPTTTPAAFAHDDEFDVLASLDDEVPLIAVVVQCLTWIWELFAEPLLFGIIGTVVDVRRLHLPTLPKAAFLVLFCVFFVRVPAAMAALSSCGKEVKLSFKERLFVGLSWMPKATVQAALGSVPLDRIHAVQKHYAGVAKMKSGAGVASLNSAPAAAASAETLEQLNRLANWGEIIVTTAVLSILLTAPIGLLVVSKLGPVMLERGNGKNEVRLHETAATSGDGAVGTNTARE